MITFKTFIIAVLVTLLLSILVWTYGCQPIKDTLGLEDKVPESKVVEVVKWKDRIQRIYETNWLATVFVICCAVSILAIVQGAKFGWAALASSIGGLIILRIDQRLAESLWFWFGAGVIGLVCLGIYLWHTIRTKKAGAVKDKTISNVVLGIEDYRFALSHIDMTDELRAKVLAALKSSLKNRQNPEGSGVTLVEKLVDKTKLFQNNN